ncbi:hypothetical protein PspLS_09957 [Pyricularia sp. CBS 133598]|nr:hypothetical protein PspLS_09957 [Pyricularia sp. CBS 133598]
MAPQLTKWHFNIDSYLNPWIPRNPSHRLPYPLARFVGHRHPDRPQKAVGNLIYIFWAFIGVFASMLLILGVNHHVGEFRAHNAPMIVASFGAAAVLEFYSIEAPLAQPRNAIVGQVISALIGTIVATIFGGPERLLQSTSDDPTLGFRSLIYRWAGGALACAAATACMALTGTVHPPAGATALMAVVDDRIVELSWWYIPIMLLGCALMLGVALLVNNIQRRFPVYWWSPEETGSAWRRDVKEPEGETHVEMDSAKIEVDPAQDVESSSTDAECEHFILIARGLVEVPNHIHLLPEERNLLESISLRI